MRAINAKIGITSIVKGKFRNCFAWSQVIKNVHYEAVFLIWWSKNDIKRTSFSHFDQLLFFFIDFIESNSHNNVKVDKVKNTNIVTNSIMT